MFYDVPFFFFFFMCVLKFGWCLYLDYTPPRDKTPLTACCTLHSKLYEKYKINILKKFKHHVVCLLQSFQSNQISISRAQENKYQDIRVNVSNYTIDL